MSINLLPWRQNQRYRKQKLFIIRLIIYFFVFFFASLMIPLIFHSEAKQTQQKIIALQKTDKQIILHHSINRDQEALLKKLRYIQSVVQQTKQHNQSMMHTLLCIANTLPNSAVLHQLIINKQAITLSGIGNQLSDIHHYVTTLQAEKIGQSVQLINVQQDDKNPLLMRFEVKMAGQ